jgi:YidC/Oxa1 family membrane protein insertase
VSIPVLAAAVCAAHPVVWHLATALAPVGGAATTIVLCTAVLRALLVPLAVAAARARRKEAANPLAGVLPMLFQVPFFLVAYRLFLSGTVAGHANALLHSNLFGVELSTRLLGAGHPLVFLPFLALLAVLAWVAVRRTRRLAGADAPRGVLALLPFGTVVTAAFVPLAGVLYLVTTTAWTAGEQRVLDS